MKRDATQTIWRTVVFAGAMLGAPACHKKPAATTPSNNAAPTSTDPATPPTDPNATQPTQPTSAAEPAAPTEDPCGGERPRGADDDGGGGVGRGFVLS